MDRKRVQRFFYCVRLASVLTLLCVLSLHAQSARDISPQERAKDHYRLGEIYYEHGLYDEAEREFEQALTTAQNLPKDAVQKETAPQAAPSKQEVPVQRKARTGEYLISPNDTLYISVWENPDLNQEVIVRPDGKISFPLIDEVEAAGLTVKELDNAITERLKEFIRYPDVSVSLKKIAGEKVIILGEVNSPGVYALEGRKTVLEAVALARGFTDDAVLRSVVVIRGGFANPQAKRVNLAQALHKGKLQEDIRVQAQDIIFVPTKFIADLNYFLTQIIGPISRGALASQGITEFEQR